jgi:ADP-ribose pyrophosphatase YjhB (NUDIX family)
MLVPEELYSRIVQVMPIPCVDLLVTDREGRVLLIKRKHEPAAGQWWFPGGRVHFGETRAAAAVRKLKEECGLHAAFAEELGTYDVILDASAAGYMSHGITTLFQIRVENRTPVELDDQSIAFDWRTVEGWRRDRLHSLIDKWLNAFLEKQSGNYCKK